MRFLSAIFALLLSVSYVVEARAEVIYQAFNERFVDVRGKLERVKQLGYSAVQVSPPAKSIDNDVWWGRYQPVDLRSIEGPLGDERALRELIAAAHDRGLKVFVDVVLNHMADPRYLDGDLQYAEFAPWDFHYPDTRTCIRDYNDRFQVTHRWMCDANAALPDLDTSREYVRGIHKRYLRKLLDLGADGFRIDAAKHIEPEYFADVLRVIPAGKFYYGEVIGGSIEEHLEYTRYMKVTDFQILRTLLSVFSLNGDMQWLIHPEGMGGALPGRDAVVFARNHDTAMHGDFFNFGDLRDAMLAYAYLIGRGVGDAMVYRDDYADPLVTGAIAFRQANHGKPTFVRRVDEVCDGLCDARNLLVVERGDSGVMIINKSDQWVDVPRAKLPGLAEGCYRDPRNDFSVRVSRGGDGQNWVSAWGDASRGGLNIGPRYALFLQRSGRCP